MWTFWLFLGVLVTIPVTVLLALLGRGFARRGQRHRAASARRAMEITVIIGGLTLVPLLVERALTRPAMWVAAVLLAAILIFGAVGVVRDVRAGKAVR